MTDGKKVFLLSVYVLTLVIGAIPAQADAQEDARRRLLSIARDFVDRVGGNLEKADTALEQLSPSGASARNSLASIPDGEALILTVRLQNPKAPMALQSLTLEEEVTAVKEGSDIMISLSDFFSAVQFPIKVHEDGTAQGWFLRESKQFNLDIQKNLAVIDKREFFIKPKQVRLQDKDVLVKGALLAEWFNLTFSVDIAAQAIKINPSDGEFWPVHEKALRAYRSGTARPLSKPPEKPFKEEKPQLASIPNADITIKRGVEKDKDGIIQSKDQYDLQGAGDFLGYTGKTSISGTELTKINNLSLGLSKSSDKPILLGPLKARNYEFNDIQKTSVPFANDGGFERGFRFSNKVFGSTLNTSTSIEGIGTPGWDVELFRDTEFIEGQAVEASGYYSFQNVPVYAGVNRFKIMMYGPQGERREQEKVVTVGPGTQGEGLSYDVSLSQKQRTTYTENPSKNIDAGTLRFAGNFEKQISDRLVWSEGLSAGQENGKSIAYLHSGTFIAMDEDTFINGDSLLSSDGPFMLSGTVRKNYGSQRASTSLVLESENFNPGLGNTFSTPASLGLNATLTGPLRWADWVKWASNSKRGLRPRRGSYTLFGSNRQTFDGQSSTSLGVTVGGALFGLSASHSLRYIYSTFAAANSSPSAVTGALSLGGPLFGSYWRGSLSYSATPNPNIDRLFFSTSKRLRQNLHGDLSLSHRVRTGLKEISTGLQWKREKETLASSISYNSEGSLQVGMQVRFGLTVDPYTGTIVRKGGGMQNIGGISALVFLDKDGDGVMSGDDEPIPEATVEAVQLGMRMETGDDGEVFLHSLPSGKVTDVVLQDNSLFEPNWIPSPASGVSIRPRPGHVTRLLFPVWRGGEMEGTAYARKETGEKRALRDIRLSLFNDKGIRAMTVTTESDGYFLFEKIPPGRYLLLAESQDLKDSRVLPAMPLPISFGFEGTRVLGRDLYYTDGQSEMGLNLSPDLGDYLKANETVRTPLPALKPGTGATLLNLGSYHSRLLATLMWYKIKKLNPELVADAISLVKPADLRNSALTGLHTLRVSLPGGTIDDGYARCMAFDAAGYPCTVEYLPQGLPEQQVSDKKEEKKKS